MVLFYFHHSGSFELTVPYQGVGPMMGVFSTRSPHRPNGIGVSTITITRRDGCTLWFKGIDMIEGTPVLDLKRA